MFIFEMQFIWVYLDDLVGKGIDPLTILQLLVYASARIVNMALPLAILMSSIMTFGTLAENYELTAMKSAGMSLSRILRPLVVFMCALSIFSFVFANNAWPIANLKFRTLLYSIVQQRPTLNLESGVFYNGIEGISIRVMDKNIETGVLKDVLIYDHRNQNLGNRTVIRAQEGDMSETADKRFLILTLKNGVTYEEKEENNRPKKGAMQPQKPVKHMPLVSGNFETMVLRLDLSSFIFKNNDEEIFKNSFEMMTVAQLDQTIDSLAIQRDSLAIAIQNFQGSNTAQKDLNTPSITSAKNVALDNNAKQQKTLEGMNEELLNRTKFINRHKIEWHRKFTLAFSCIILFFIGAPLGAIIRKGGLGWPTILALGIFILFEMLTIAGEKMTKSNILEPYIGMWLATFVTLPMGIFITYRARMEGKWQWNIFKKKERKNKSETT
jgi:lipopolysaccharide export system permease protein